MIDGTFVKLDDLSLMKVCSESHFKLSEAVFFFLRLVKGVSVLV